MALGHVRVVNLRGDGECADETETLVRVDRANPVLGNHNHHMKRRGVPKERARVIAGYELELSEDLKRQGPKYEAIIGLAERLAQGENLALGCWCSPLNCHADTLLPHIREHAKRIFEDKKMHSNDKMNRSSKMPTHQIMYACADNIEGGLRGGFISGPYPSFPVDEFLAGGVVVFKTNPDGHPLLAMQEMQANVLTREANKAFRLCQAYLEKRSEVQSQDRSSNQDDDDALNYDFIEHLFENVRSLGSLQDQIRDSMTKQEQPISRSELQAGIRCVDDLMRDYIEDMKYQYDHHDEIVREVRAWHHLRGVIINTVESLQRNIQVTTVVNVKEDAQAPTQSVPIERQSRLRQLVRTRERG